MRKNLWHEVNKNSFDKVNAFGSFIHFYFSKEVAGESPYATTGKVTSDGPEGYILEVKVYLK